MESTAAWSGTKTKHDRKKWAFVRLAVAALLIGGCKSQPLVYRYGGDLITHQDARLQPVEPQAERGRPHRFVDGVGWVVGVPRKVLLWDLRVDNHRVSPGTEIVLLDYLNQNDLDQVKVRINQYAPGDEWRRLKRHKSVGAGWRYTFGTLTWLGYTLFPGRVWGGDNYNPYTNTVSIYSDVPPLAILEGAEAKLAAKRKLKGTYAFWCRVPWIGYLVGDGPAYHEALQYLLAQGSVQRIREGTRILMPATGLAALQNISPLFGSPKAVAITAVVVAGTGQICGRVFGAILDEDDFIPAERTTAGKAASETVGHVEHVPKE